MRRRVGEQPVMRSTKPGLRPCLSGHRMGRMEALNDSGIFALLASVQNENIVSTRFCVYDEVLANDIETLSCRI